MSLRNGTSMAFTDRYAYLTLPHPASFSPLLPHPACRSKYRSVLLRISISQDTTRRTRAWGQEGCEVLSSALHERHGVSVPEPSSSLASAINTRMRLSGVCGGGILGVAHLGIHTSTSLRPNFTII
jgi:hypothetical protein